METYDLVILGGGPTGLAAGLYGTRSRLKTLVLERGTIGGQLAVTEDIENYPGIEAITGPELGQKMLDHAEKFGLEMEYVDVESVDLESEIKVVRTDGKEFHAKALVIATGSTHNKLEIPGEDEFSGRGVSYCAVCDGAFFRDRDLIVVGGGDAAVEEGTYLTRFASKVTIVHRRDELRATKVLQERAFANPKMDFLWDSTVEEVKGNGLVASVAVKNLKEDRVYDRPVDGVFIYVGLSPNSQFLEGVLPADEMGHLHVNLKMETKFPGVFAAGDIREQSSRQVASSVGDGATAAIFAEKYIAEHFTE
ncbi:MAG: thioredoxin-disulfide reductase [Dehalococcoidia bacterium]|jgi:thioredoxin reductase (NADPH)|nr:thioredoxin-disulfide reductase [Dehalococcoidia bacterium]